MKFPWIDRFLEKRLFALIQKEIRQILRDKQLLFLLVFPPTFQLLLYGFALDPDVKNLRIAIADLSASPISRELVSAIVENHVFDISKVGYTESAVCRAVAQGRVEAALIIPPEFNRRIKEGLTGNIQIFLDGADANTAGIAGGYLSQMIGSFARSLQMVNLTLGSIHPDITFLYNPGLESAWFFVPGVMGLVLNLTGSLVSTSTLIREKDSGTLEQLIMTPASSVEVLVAKILPLFFLLMGNVCIALAVGKFVFDVPFRGDALLYFFVSGLYVFVAISIGITLASISKNQRGAVLTSFFINLPVIMLSGATAPIQSMPRFFQYIALLNPLRYYIVCIRSILLKGVGLDIVWPNVVMLAIFAVGLLALSANRFRKQLG
ncbi:MAG: ABC transporter permease [Candidatus Melainabacteria bacterium]|nr:MAG: ABC transporter permease [Candidatus Melainabacteria bacterium]